MIKSALKKTLSHVNYLYWKLKRKPQKIKCKNVLIVNKGFVGDVLAMTPLIKELSKNKIEVSVLIQKSMEPLLQNNPHISEILFKKTKKYDAVILISPTSFIKKISPQEKLIMQSPHSSFLSKKIYWLSKSESQKKEHKVIQNLRFLEAFGISPNQKINPLNYPLEIHLDKNTLSKLGKKFNLPKKYIIISPGSRSQVKMGIKLLSEAKLLQTSRYLSEKHSFSSVVVGIKDDKELFKKNSQTIVNLIGKTSLEELIAIVALSEGVVGVDSGTIHIASCFNKKTLVFMRKNMKDLWYPWQDKKNWVALTGSNKNLDTISLQAIKNALDRLFA